MSLESSPPSIREGQLRSAFTSILEVLCESCVGALAAGLVDHDGECVDLASVFGPRTKFVEPPGPAPAAGAAELQQMQGYAIKLCGAHWQIVMRDAASSASIVRSHGAMKQMWVRTDSFSYVVGLLHDGYVLALICEPDALAAVSPRALRQVEVELALEAGWPVPEPDRPFWRRVRVRLDPLGRPNALRYARTLDGESATWDSSLAGVTPVEGLDGFERGFLIVLRSHETLLLVREPSGFWYAASQPDGRGTLPPFSVRW
jgi:hypothetical protein